ncbi:MAG: hypothetical protein Q9220_006152 [cf. Caloplaca sp. 1 TL-2023]
MHRSDRNVFQVLDEQITDLQSAEVNRRVTRWIDSIPSPRPHSSPGSHPPYRRQLRPRSRLPLSVIQNQAQQQPLPVTRKRKPGGMDQQSRDISPSKNLRARKPPKTQQGGVTEEQNENETQKTRRPKQGQKAPTSNIPKSDFSTSRNRGESSAKMDNKYPRIAGKGKERDFYSDSGTLDAFSDLHVDPLANETVPSKNARPQRAAVRSTIGSGNPPSTSIGIGESASVHASQSSTASRPVTSKESLALMRPPVQFVKFSRINEPGMQMSPEAHILWADYISPALSSPTYIPDTLKPYLDDLSNTPSGRVPAIPASEFVTPTKPASTAPEQVQQVRPKVFTWHRADHEMVREQVFDIYQQADLWRDKCDEDFWIDIVVSPLMHLVRKMTDFHHGQIKRNTPRLSVLNLKTRPIKPDSLISTSDTALFKALNKKIDMAIGLNLFQMQEDELQSRTYNVEAVNPSINQVQACFNFTPMFVNAEVKRKHQNKDPLVQLGAWVAAEFSKRNKEGWPLNMPVVAIAVEQDEWQLFIVHHVSEGGKGATQESFKLRFVGPVKIGSTANYQGIFRILFVLCTLGNWGEQVYRPWFYKVHDLTDT